MCLRLTKLVIMTCDTKKKKNVVKFVWKCLRYYLSLYMKPQERNYYNTYVRTYDVLIIFNGFFLQHKKKKKSRGAVITIRTGLTFIIFIIPLLRWKRIRLFVHTVHWENFQFNYFVCIYYDMYSPRARTCKIHVGTHMATDGNYLRWKTMLFRWT